MSTAMETSGATSLPPVRSVRVKLAAGAGLLDQLPLPGGALTWVRRGDGLVGWGEAARLEISGPDRVEQGRDWWRALVAATPVDDQVDLPGSGPVAFGSFTFADDTASPSVLVVPRVVLGRRDGVTWLTTVGPAPRPAAPAPVTAPGWLRYSAGESSVTAFREGVAEAVRRIRDGELAKVVLAHDLLVTAAEPIDPRFLLARLAERYAECHAFAVDGLVGATPELLVGRSGERVVSRVLAGTTTRGAGPVEDRARSAALMSSAKDREEHRYAVESLAGSLEGRVADLDVAGSPHLLQLSNVAHLATEVTGRLVGDADVLDLVAALHPTAAVGGTPADTAVALLAELEGMDRGRYAGPVGWVDAHGDGEWGIALRCAQLEGATARLFAGCGIVADSDPDDEVAEAQAKFVPVRDALEGLGA